MVFFAGKIVNALLSVTIFYLIAANLTKPEFAVYAWLIAFVELSTNISRFGINWAIDRYVPELRSNLNSIALRQFILGMLGLRLVIILVLALAFYGLGHQLLSLGDKEDWLPAFDVYIVVLVPFAVMVFLRDAVFQSLLQQAYSAATTAIRHLVFLCCLFFFLAQPEPLELMSVIYGEIIATMVAMSAALLQLTYILRAFPYSTLPKSASRVTWRAVLRFAANSYGNEVLRMSGSGYAVMSAAPNLLATAALAPYGFCQTLFAQLNRFLPAHLFSGLYRPKLVAQYTKTRSFEVLNRQLVTILKISNYMLAMSIAVFFAYGREILDWLSKGKYGDAHHLMILFMLLMLVDNHRQVLMALCNTIERVDILRRASMVMPLVVPLAFAMVFIGLDAYGLALSLILPELVCIGLIIFQLRRSGFVLRFGARGQARIAAASLVTIIAGFLIEASLPASPVWTVAGMAITALVFVATARLLRPMNEQERAAIERLVGRPVYVL